MSTDYPEPIFIRPDVRFFVDDGRTAEEARDLVFRVLEGFGNDSETISEFMNRVYKSLDVVFAFFYGSVLNFHLGTSEIEDVDVFIATQNRKFVYDWAQPKGMEIRYHLVSEIEDYLKVGRKFFLPVFKREFNTLGGIFANAVLAIKFSKQLDNMVRDVRKNFKKIHVKALSQIVENDCKKRMERMPPSSRGKRLYSFYGSESLISLDEALSMIGDSLKRKNIKPAIAPAISRRILKGMKARGPSNARQLT